MGIEKELIERQAELIELYESPGETDLVESVMLNVACILRKDIKELRKQYALQEQHSVTIYLVNHDFSDDKYHIIYNGPLTIVLPSQGSTCTNPDKECTNRYDGNKCSFAEIGFCVTKQEKP
jgi:hypothetical protein